MGLYDEDNKAVTQGDLKLLDYWRAKFNAEQMEGAIDPPHDHLPRSRLLVLENTHNRAGGRVFPQNELERIANRAHERGLAVHLDGARLWNASAASGCSP